MILIFIDKGFYPSGLIFAALSAPPEGGKRFWSLDKDIRRGRVQEEQC